MDVTRTLVLAWLTLLGQQALASEPYIVFDEFDKATQSYPAGVLDRMPLMRWLLGAPEFKCYMQTAKRQENNYNIETFHYCPQLTIRVGNEVAYSSPYRMLEGVAPHLVEMRIPADMPTTISLEVRYPEDFSDRLLDVWDCPGNQECEPPSSHSSTRPLELNGRVFVTTHTLALQKKFLLASIGDSFASGEGLPNFCGKKRSRSGALVDTLLEIPVDILDTPVDAYNLAADPSLKNLYDFALPSGTFLAAEYLARDQCLMLSANMERQPDWHDDAGRRSGRAASFVVGARMAKSGMHGLKHVNLAMSGAKIPNLVQPGQQIDRLKEVVGTKTIDALLISIGGNDAGFAQILQDLTANPNFLLDDLISEARSRLPSVVSALQEVVRKLSDSGVIARHIYLVSYPGGFFSVKRDDPYLITPFPDTASVPGHPEIVDARGCGVFDTAGLAKVSASEASALRKLAGELNDALSGFVDQQNQGVIPNRRRWHFVGGISDRFDGSGYCAKNTYFVHWGASCKCQGSYHGVAHPNSFGVGAIADSIAQALEPQLRSGSFQPLPPIIRDPSVIR